MAHVKMDWEPTVYDFVSAFRRFGFKDSKRSMSARSKISKKKATPATAAAAAVSVTTAAASGAATTTEDETSAASSNKKRRVAFPSLNMQYVLVFLVLCLRTQ